MGSIGETCFVLSCKMQIWTVFDEIKATAIFCLKYRYIDLPINKLPLKYLIYLNASCLHTGIPTLSPSAQYTCFPFPVRIWLINQLNPFEAPEQQPGPLCLAIHSEKGNRPFERSTDRDVVLLAPSEWFPKSQLMSCMTASFFHATNRRKRWETGRKKNRIQHSFGGLGRSNFPDPPAHVKSFIRLTQDEPILKIILIRLLNAVRLIKSRTSSSRSV